MARKNREVESWYKPPQEPVCPLCERPIPKSQEDEHHLVPKVKGGKVTKTLHRICHRQIHALFTESELANKYSSVEELLQVPAIQDFVKWVKTKPNDFLERVKQSRQKR